MGEIIFNFLKNILIGDEFIYADDVSIVLTALTISLIYIVLIKFVYWLFGVGKNGTKTRRY